MSRKEKSAETEHALKAAALRLFAERGYLNTKIADITTEAGRAAGSFYNHFAGKEELLQALLNDIETQADVVVEGPDHNADFTDPDAVRFHIEQYWLSYRRHWAVFRSMQQAALVNDDFARQLGEFAKQQLRDIADHLDGFAEKGLTLPSTPNASLAMMFQLTTAMVQGIEDGTVELTDKQAVDGLTRFIYRGLTGRDC
ncbi:TetR/AcrR family transcriptional regulator [Nocardia sp. NPDC049149]|uniref:TetR/AcrR family transcriptional regulator n=1 Tax=Nocardia sp. NPDC049149 TaxID=3364315 RepID=UPI003710B6DF